MMDQIFLIILNMSITATYVLAIVLVLRLLLKRAPKWIKDRVANILNFKKPVVWVMVAVVILLVVAGFALLSNPPSNANQDDLATLNGFAAALKRELGTVVDITEQEYKKRAGSFTEYQRILQYDSENVFAELAVDQTLEKIVNDRLADINNPLVDRIWPVHLYVKGNLVVEFAGRNVKILGALVKLLGTELPHDIPFTGTSLIDSVTTSSSEIDAEEAIAIAKSRFAEYLLTKPEMKVEDPVYTAKKTQYQDKTEYWSITISLKEPEYIYHYYEVQITVDGDKVTLATG